MELTRIIKDSVKKEVKNKLEDIYQEYIYPYNEITFDLFIDNVIEEKIEAKVSERVEISADIIKPTRDRINKTKQRWYKKAISKKGELYHEVDVVAKGLYENLPSDQKDNFKTLYGVSDYKELKKARLKELKKWLKDNEIPLTYFRYLNLKAQYQIEKAIVNDIEFIILNVLKENFRYGQQSAIMQMPKSMGKIPYDHTNRIKINIANIAEEVGGKYFFNEYYIDDDKYFQTSADVRILKEDVTISVLKVLNYRDTLVFSSVMSRRDENFYSTREIVVDIGDIVKEVFNSGGQKNYIAVKESLYRLQYINSRIVDSSLSGFTLKIFDNINIQENVATIVVNIDIVNEFVKHNTINMYKENIDKFKLNSSKILIFKLQSERIKQDSIKQGSDSLILKTNINFFRAALYFPNTKRQENIKTIEDALDEIVENKVTLKRYERKGDIFLLEFYPVTEQERKDLFFSPSDSPAITLKDINK